MGAAERCETPLIVQCPNCSARFQVEIQDLQSAAGCAKCCDCGSLFDAFSEQPVEATNNSEPLSLDATSRIGPMHLPGQTAAHLPFDVPDGLEPLRVGADDALDVDELLREPSSRPRTLVIFIAALLLLALGAQLAWQQRNLLLQRFPALGPLCDYVACHPTLIHAPDEFFVLQRKIAPTANAPGSLTLSVQVRNDASVTQALPDIQLSLLDNNGTVLIRRRLSPADYQFPPPPEAARVTPGEVFTIDLDFEDPGDLATGFIIDFL